jgi:hypothetical protein
MDQVLLRGRRQDETPDLGGARPGPAFRSLGLRPQISDTNGHRLIRVPAKSSRAPEYGI